MRKTWGLAVLLPVALVAGCAGVGGSDSGGGGNGGDSGGSGSSSWSGTPSGTLTTMGFGGEDEVGTSRVAAFKAAAPDVKVTINKGDFDAQQFLTAVSSGNPPDVVYMSRQLIGTYAAKGAIQPLDQCISGQQIDTSQYRPAAMKSVTLGDKVYGIPEFYVVQANLIDGTALGSAGVTTEQIQTKDWDALAATSAKLFQQDGSKIKRLGYDPKLPDSFPQWAMANGATIVGDDGAPHLDDPKAVEALKYTVDLVKSQGGWTKFKSFRDSYDIFGEKNPLTVHSIAAFPMENWYVNVLRDSIPAGLKLQSTPFTDRQGQPTSLLGGSAWAIPKGAKNPVAACAWAKTMTSTDTWMKAAEARQQKVEQDKSFFTGLFTANKPADDQIREKYLKDAPDPGFKAAIDNFYGSLDSAKALNPSAAGAEIDAAWKSAVSRALEGQDPAQALAQAQKEAQTAFEKVSSNG
ncbi:MAG: extracellular solute-binding protein [Ornithinibacter sp.]